MSVRLVWEGKPTQVERLSLPLQTVETINESGATRRRDRDSLFGANGASPEDRNLLVWGDNKLVMSSLLNQYAGQPGWLDGLPTAPREEDVELLVPRQVVRKGRDVLRGLALCHTAATRAMDSSLHPDARQEAAELQARARRYLERALAYGLEQRRGAQLHGYEETVYLHLVAHVGKTAAPRVCEECLAVFEGTRAARCRRCRRGPVRAAAGPGLHPVPPDRAAITRVGMTRGDTSVAISVAKSRGDRRLHYRRMCAGCGQAVVTRDARQRYCARCGGPAGRVARHRRRRARAAGSG